ncbi:MAG: aminopeptidase [Spirochaetaceae bacterium]|nr:aminopeptidase [Spirochaetaceae bacterium]
MKYFPRTILFAFPPFAAALLVAAAAVLFSGCYVLRQGTTMLGYLNTAVPLESLQESADEEERLFAQRVTDIRDFAAALGLERNSNYTTYVEIDRKYLAAVVSASHRDSFTRHEWWFPVTGSVPYKGFFSEEEAKEEARCLQSKDLDVWVRRVDAFSTLGWFSDPLYSYMKSYPLRRLAGLIIHEQVHATVYVAGASRLNEQLAEFVGTEGARLYMAHTFGEASEEYAAMMNEEEDARAFLVFIRGLIAELQELYAGDSPREEKLRRKELAIAAAQKRFEENYAELFRTPSYRGFSRLAVNNAYLELFRLYYAEDNYFADIYEGSGRDLKKFIAAARVAADAANTEEAFRPLLEKALLGSGQ